VVDRVVGVTDKLIVFVEPPALAGSVNATSMTAVVR
jgi:hypothetical protein